MSLVQITLTPLEKIQSLVAEGNISRNAKDPNLQILAGSPKNSIVTFITTDSKIYHCRCQYDGGELLPPIKSSKYKTIYIEAVDYSNITIIQQLFEDDLQIGEMLFDSPPKVQAEINEDRYEELVYLANKLEILLITC